MSMKTETSAETRVPLSRERVLRAAIALADSSGIEALTMRRLGRELGVEAMSLYNHVANKEDILFGMAELVFGQVVLPSSESDWKTALRTSAISAYETLRRHPWAHGITMSPSRTSQPRLLWMEAVLRTLRECGFSAEQSCHAYHALDSHITGFTLWQATLPATGQELRRMAESFLPRIPIAEYPYVVEHIQQHLVPPRPEDKGTFAFGLDLILDGLERMRDTD